MLSLLQVALLTTALCCRPAHGFVIKASSIMSDEGPENSTLVEEGEESASSRIEKANANIGDYEDDEMTIVDMDIAVPTGLGNADPCTGRTRSCLWPKATDGRVYVPFTISNQYAANERNVILQGLNSFTQPTCIRFYQRRNERAFLNIQSRSGCSSFVGRQGNGQPVSLQRRGCIFLGTIQHELLHALGFDHEQTRSDRDQNVRILLQNVQPGTEGNFRRIQTRNLNTPYNYRSVMHYSGTAFSRNGRPTIVPIPNPNVRLGNTQMDPTDILRVNRLYQCRTFDSMTPPMEELDQI